MNNNLKESDFYIVYNNYKNYNFGRELNILYLPLIGVNSIKLYEYLFYKLLNDSNMSDRYLHYDLTENLLLNTKQLLLARKKLEALGLLKSYYYNENSESRYVYEILRPLSFSEFFSTQMLPELLKNSVGVEKYEDIKNNYPTSKVSFKVFTDVSAKFTDIFNEEDPFINVKSDNVGPNLSEYYFDFNRLNSILSAKYIDVILENSNLRTVILELAHLYKVQADDMAKAIENSIDRASAGNNIDVVLLKDYLNQLYVNVKKQVPPSLDNMINKQLLKETYSEDKEMSKKERYAKELDNINYIDFLNKRHDIIISEIDSKNIILKLQDKYNFTSGVLNVLLDYAIRNSNSRGIPHYNYLDKIASSWTGQKLITALDAINFVNKDRKIKNERIVKKVNTTAFSTYKNNTFRKEVPTPDYIKNQLVDMINNNKSNAKQEVSDDSFDEFLKEKGAN